MKIFCPVWGFNHISLLKTALGRSLSWPKNNKAIENAEWIITCARDDESKDITEIIKRIQPLSKIKFYILPEIASQGIDTGQVLVSTLKDTIKSCLINNDPLLMATPDFIYGDGTIDAFKTLGSEPGSCVAIAHLRVLPSLFLELDKCPTNQELMAMAFRHPHSTWVHADAKSTSPNTFKCGVRWWDLGGGLRAVQHFMPSPFYVNFLSKDLESFDEYHEGRPPGFGMWDHVWPTSLINDGRLKFIGSSDLAMMIEVTEPFKNVAPLNCSSDPPGFFRKHFHNEIQKQFISVFRGV